MSRSGENPGGRITLKQRGELLFLYFSASIFLPFSAPCYPVKVWQKNGGRKINSLLG
jgi:hypothetical protein